ncbi:serine/threonine-protein kinase pim-2-like [Scomber scombrus]|uniref:serine/threonine-protein kinase pim-2-like n=1 Tax=Scomber scombrus TaxID=13677 RepID=UPI002DDBD62C|nr:serine/threonine-protein kinase pim-2-like [Scomber scombrus]
MASMHSHEPLSHEKYHKNKTSIIESGSGLNSCNSTDTSPTTSDTSTCSSKASADVQELRKRKASPHDEMPSKRQRCTSSSTSETSPSSSKAQKRTRESSAGEEEPRKRQKSSERSQNSCGSSSSQEEKETTLPGVNTSKADFDAKYMRLGNVRNDDFGFAYDGCRTRDFLPVTIKHVQGAHVIRQMDLFKIPIEVALMKRASGGPESVGKSASLTLLDWYYVEHDVILVIERPAPCLGLKEYLDFKGGTLQEQEAKVFMTQLVEASIEMFCKGVFHRDIRSENILIEMDPPIPRCRIANFACTLACAPPEWYVYGEYHAGPTTAWQLGAMLYRWLHGFKNSTFGILSGKMQLSKDSATPLSEDCLDFLQLCLRKNPSERGNLRQLQRHPWLK